MDWPGLFSSAYLCQGGAPAPDSLTPHLLPTVPCRCSCAKQADGLAELSGSESSCPMPKAVFRRAILGWVGGSETGLEQGGGHTGELTCATVKSSLGWSGCLASIQRPVIGTDSWCHYKSKGLGTRLFCVCVLICPLLAVCH